MGRTGRITHWLRRLCEGGLLDENCDTGLGGNRWPKNQEPQPIIIAGRGDPVASEHTIATSFDSDADLFSTFNVLNLSLNTFFGDGTEI